MKKTAQAFVAPGPGTNAWRAVLTAAPSAALVDAASALIHLQEARHNADYDLGRVFTRVESETLVARAETAFQSWASVTASEERDAFLVGLLIRGRT